VSATDPGLPAAVRVALLAREGQARQQLRGALLGAGAQITLEDDPNTLDADALAASRPHAVLVALEPAIEDALLRLGSGHLPVVDLDVDRAHRLARELAPDSAAAGASVQALGAHTAPSVASACSQSSVAAARRRGHASSADESLALQPLGGDVLRLLAVDVDARVQ